MIRLELVIVTKEYVRYKFFPDDKGEDFGVVQVDIKTKKRSLVSDMENGTSDWYLLHAWNYVERFIDRNDYPEKIIVGWC